MNYDVTSSTEPVLLPKAVRFVKKKQLPFIEYRYSITPSSGDTTYSAGSQIVYQPKLSKNTFKCVYGPASFHASCITMTATNGAYIDGISNCVINQCVEIGQDTVSDFRNSNAFINLQLDFTVDADIRKSFWSFFGGAPQTQTNLITTAGTSATATTIANLQTYLASNAALATQMRTICGLNVANSNAGADGIADMMWALAQQMNRGNLTQNLAIGDYIATTGTGFYAQLIPGSVIGALQTRLFPLSEVNNGYSLTFNLESVANAFIGDQTAFTLSKNRLHLCVIEFNEALSSLMRSAFQNVFTIPTSGITNVSTQFTGVTSVTWQVPISLTNAKSIYFVFRHAAQFAAGYATQSQRVKIKASKYQLQIGSRTLPANRWVEMDGSGVNNGDGLCDVESFMETSKAFGNTISNNAMTGTVSYKTYNTNIDSAAAATKYTPGHFCIAYNLDGIIEQTDEYRACSQLESNNTFLTVTFYASTATAVYIDCYVLYEMDLVIVDGALTVQNKLNAFSSGIP